MSFLNRASSDLGAVSFDTDGSPDYVGTAFYIIGRAETFLFVKNL